MAIRTKCQIRSKYFFPTVSSWFALLTLSFMATISYASSLRDITDAEMALLPRYCVDTEVFKYGAKGSPNQSPRAAYWENLMGPGFWTLHHACMAKIGLMRSYRNGVTPELRKFLRESARADYVFVIENTRPDFILLPEIYTEIGKLELQLSRPGNAEKSFAQARKLKPDYWPAYSYWADHLIASGKKEYARELLKTGLEYSPQAKLLIESYKKVGGKLADITPRSTEPASDSGKDDTGTGALEK